MNIVGTPEKIVTRSAWISRIASAGSKTSITTWVEPARQLAATHGIYLEGLGGTQDGVIGARDWAELQGVVGAPGSCEAFARKWKDLTGRGHRLRVRMRQHALSAVNDVPAVPGSAPGTIFAACTAGLNARRRTSGSLRARVGRGHSPT